MISSMLRIFLLSILTVSIGSAIAQSIECKSDECEAPTYELRIINNGESEPAKENNPIKGQQQNRRVDVTITTEEETQKVLKDRRTEFDTGGTVWISQEPHSLSRLLEITAATRVSLEESRFSKPVVFTLDTNYSDFITQWEIVIWREGQSDSTDPLHTISGVTETMYTPSEWDGNNAQDIIFKENDRLEYALRVYDANRNMDQTPRKLLLIDANKPALPVEESPLIVDFESFNSIVERMPEPAIQGINLNGSKVRVYGQGFDPTAKINVNGKPVTLSAEGKFAMESIKAGSKAEVNVKSQLEGYDLQTKTLSVDLNQDYFFMLGLADLTIGKNSVTGNVDVLEVDEHHYGGDLFIDGRLAFYLKGKIKGKYLLTAQMDTGTDDIERIFDDFHKKDSRSIFRRLDPDQYYPVYGDGSTLTDDTNSQGKLYVRLEWDKSWALWGNYNTSFNGTALSPFNRSLYGAQLVYQNTGNTALGDTQRQLSAFASQAQSLFRQNEFIGTGGSLYYLRDTDIVRGSEKIWVEVRRNPGDRVIDKIELVPDRDYEIDYFQGRIILRRPLVSATPGGNPSIIRDQPLDGDRTYLVVDYEFSPTDLNVNDTTAGIRAKQWLGDHVAIGGTWAHETREQQDYDLKGADLTIKKSDNTFVKLEFSQTAASFQSARFSSDDGGLSFINSGVNGDEITGNAASVEAQISAIDFDPESLEKRLTGWARQYEAGFATSNQDSQVDTSDMGLEAAYSPHTDWGLYAALQRYEEKDQLRESILSGKLTYQPLDWLTLGSEYQRSLEENLGDGSKGSTDVAAASASADVNERLNIYGIQQATVRATGNATNNTLTTIGSNYQATDSLKLNAEVSSGDRGDSALLGVDWWYNDTYQLYTNYLFSNNINGDPTNSVVLGQRKSIDSNLKIYTEHQVLRDSDSESFAHALGLDNRINKFTSINLSFQMASLESDEEESIDRKTLSAGIAYQKDKYRFNGKYEFREDKGQVTELTQWVTTNRFEFQRSASLRWQGQFNASLTTDENEFEDARFIEAGFGFAFRPIEHDRLNMLGRFTYLYDLQPTSQSDGNDQRSYIVSTDALYDVSKRWSVGGKLAHRVSEIRVERNAGPWVSNDASLAGVRVRRHIPFGIDFSASYRLLWSDETDGIREGALLTVGKRVGHHLTFSTGYNFTNFDDNLANDSFDAKGWFLNLVGTY